VEHCRTGDGSNEERSSLFLTTESTSSKFAVFTSAENDTHSFEFNDSVTGFARHYFNGILISQEVTSLDGVISVTFPIIATVRQRSVNSALRSV
jgi:hypothetical protein